MDHYKMPIVDMLVNASACHDILSFLDGHAGYNQFYIVEEDIHKTASMCPGDLGIYEWAVTPFGINNAGATYQCAINAIFQEMVEMLIEVYINDVIVKSTD